jgi:hypothetical protein
VGRPHCCQHRRQQRVHAIVRVLVCHKPKKKSNGRRKSAKSRECLNVRMSSLKANARANNARSARKGQGAAIAWCNMEVCMGIKMSSKNACSERMLCVALSYDPHLYCHTTLSALHCPQRRSEVQCGSTARPKDAAWPSCHAPLAFVESSSWAVSQFIRLFCNRVFTNTIV